MRGNVSRWDRSAGADDHAGAIMLVVLLAGIIFGGVLFWRMSLPAAAGSIDVLGVQSAAKPPTRPGSGYQPPAQGQAQSQPQPQRAEPQAQPTPQPQPTAAAAPSADMAHVAHTDGVGVVLRSEPKESAWTPRGFMDGAEVTILERQGDAWVRVRGPNGQEGWVPARYLGQ